jgi:hypothetical protein
MGRGIILGLLAVLPVAGCNSARYVVQQSDGGIVAIPSNTNMWPFKHRDSAEDLIRQHVGPNFEIVDEREALIGSRASGSEPTGRTTQEYRISYRRKIGPFVPVQPSGGIGPVVPDQSSGGNPPVVSPASSVVPSIAPPETGVLPAGGPIPTRP